MLDYDATYRFLQMQSKYFLIDLSFFSPFFLLFFKFLDIKHGDALHNYNCLIFCITLLSSIELI